jgi:RNA polymerase sigma-70 factor (ECF subfamily)
LRITAANGRPALAAYEMAPDGRASAYGLMVLTTTDGAIAGITGFRATTIFAAFGLPATLD